MNKRFWSKVEKSEDCWSWLLSHNACGYGRFSINSKPYLAHRVAYELTYGPIPEGLHVCHTCDNPGCVNPDHLWLGSHEDNQRDKAMKLRGIRGERVCTAKLTEDDIPRVRDMIISGASNADIGRWFDVNPSTISNIRTGKTWRHVR